MTDIVPTAVYILCFLTSTACAWMLGRSYMRSRAPFLFWSSLCFLLLAGNNLLLVFDLLVFPSQDMRIVRLLLALAAVGTLLFGLVWDLEEE